MSSSKKRFEGAKPDLARPGHPISNEIVDPTPDYSTELTTASHAATTRDEISKRNADSPLLRLPAELRNNIFALALAQGDIKWNYGAWLKNKNSVNLLYVCRQTYVETALLPYSLNTFSCIKIHTISLYKFLKCRTPAQRAAMLAVPREYPYNSGRKLVFSAAEWMAICQAGLE